MSYWIWIGISGRFGVVLEGKGLVDTQQSIPNTSITATYNKVQMANYLNKATYSA